MSKGVKVKVIKPISGRFMIGVVPGKETIIYDNEKLKVMVDEGYVEVIAQKPAAKRETRKRKKAE